MATMNAMHQAPVFTDETHFHILHSGEKKVKPIFNSDAFLGGVTTMSTIDRSVLCYCAECLLLSV